MFIKRLKLVLAGTKLTHRTKPLAFMVVFAGIGLATLLLASAATPYIALEPESGTVSLPAITVDDENASLQSAVKFGVGSNIKVVTFVGGKMLVNGAPYVIRGVNYNPTYVGSDQIDPLAAPVDVPKIKALGANTIGTYLLGKAEWEQYSDLPAGDAYYDQLMPAAEQVGLGVVVAYFSNNTIDWTDTVRVAKVTGQYQELVTKSKSSSATLMYMIGNEIFEKLSSDTQRQAYATWIGAMTNWTHQNDPHHPVFYADRADLNALNWLKTYAPNMDVYGVNNYSFTNSSALKSNIQSYMAAWPGKPILIHEWGADSLNVVTNNEDLTMHSNAVSLLAQAVDTVSNDVSVSMIGGIQFEYSDEWRFVGSPYTQDKDTGWACASCSDGKANEDYWGLARAAGNNQAGSRTFKPAYDTLKSIWNN